MQIIRPHVLLDAELDSSNVSETSPAADEWSSATAYVADDLATVTYTGAGASVATHFQYKCLVGHTNQDPTATGVADGFWEIHDATNRWRAFNNVLQQKTTNTDTINYQITPGEIVTSMAFFGVDAQSINVTMTDPVEGEVYNTDFSMVSPSGITNWWLYFYEEIVRESRLFLNDLPNFPDATLDITVDDTGDTATCGEIVFGTNFIIGDSQNGASFSIIDYSVKTTDAEGNIRITPGAYADIADVNVVIETNRFDAIQTTLKAYKSQPVVWVPSEDIAQTMVYGYFRNFRNAITGPVVSTTLLQLEGLT